MRSNSGIISLVALGAIGLTLSGACASTASQPETAPSAVSFSDPPPNEWTPEWRALVTGEWEKVISLIPFAVTAEARERLSQCFARRFFGAFPGGPAEFERLDPALVSSMSEKIGELCGHEFIDWVSSLDSWNPAAAPTFVFSCVAAEGEVQRSYCTCLGVQAPNHYGTARGFFQAMQALEDESEMQQADLAAAEALIGTCVHHLGWSPTTIAGMIEGCIGEAGAHMASYCSCMFETAPKYYETPAAFTNAIDREKDGMSLPEVAVLEHLMDSCSGAEPAFHRGPGALQ